MTEKVISAGFSNTDLVEFNYHIDPYDYSDSSLELIVQDRLGNQTTLTFKGVSNVEIQEGFNGCLNGMEIIDISDRQWSHALIEVRSFEQDPCIRFLAMQVDISGNT
ncbi:hypothetical protein MHO82_22820 [Vibrio sp. Of7-15]|uniref:hypothetical protein n=1 Tax=Vibrio sp. Of7-15 TaxID=2724879 RepID=UPI001EF2A23E|nr:hypothetical protein [Vibrio sp. Of7-15]MCG7499702.1 hypothetical protein [Vibrio sp. Of7-15]